MIDIKFLRENPDAVRENIKKKFQDSKLPLVDEVIELDDERKAAMVTNLLVVLCADESAQPVVNAGTMHH